MATFRKRGKKWSYRINMGINPETNKRIQLTISHNTDYPGGFKTKEEAKTAATAHQYELDHGTYVKVKDIMFVDLAKEWFKHYGKEKKISTLRVREYQLLRLTRFFKSEKAKDITKKKYLEFLDDMAVRRLGFKTRSGTHVMAKMLFDFAIQYDYIKFDPTQYAKVPKPQETVEEIENKVEIPKFLEKEELSIFLRTAQEKGLDGDYPMFLTLAYSGMRDGELCALKKSDFLRDDKKVSITKTIFHPTCRTTEYFLLPPKNKGSIREIELEMIVFDAIDTYLVGQNEYKMLHRKTYHNKDFVFYNQESFPGYPFIVDKLGYRMKRLLTLAKLDTNLTPHSLRHTHTSLCAEAGVPLEDIMDRLGHVDDKTTKSVYLHVTKKRKKEASQKFGELMKNL